MVLRGSKIRPESNLEDANLAVQRARDYLKQTKKKLEEAKNAKMLKGALADIKRRQSMGEYVDPKELHEIVRLLLEKIDSLEQAERDGKERVMRAEKNVQNTILQLASGGAAGAIARTFVAPIDRVKILMQTQYASPSAGAATKATAAETPAKYHSLSQSLRRIVTEEGVARLWRGNGVNCIRVVPYSASQFVVYDKLKASLLESTSGQTFGLYHRLTCGAGAAMVATALTYPLDMVRLRLSVEPELNGFKDSVRSILADGSGSPRAFFKGFVPTVCSITPFVAINFAIFDTWKSMCFKARPSLEGNVPVTLMLGAASGLFAQTCCYPLDTIRRRMQLKGRVYNGLGHAFRTILEKEGVFGFYRGMLPNAVKVVPNTAVRFMAYDFLKRSFGLESSTKR